MQQGGAVFSQKSSYLTFDKCLFKKNWGLNNWGGALGFNTVSNLNITESVFLENNSTSGGALAFVSVTKSYIINSEFNFNLV